MSDNLEIKKNINPSIKKIKILFTIVDRSKSLFYSDLLEQFEVNMQTIIYVRQRTPKMKK